MLPGRDLSTMVQGLTYQGDIIHECTYTGQLARPYMRKWGVKILSTEMAVKGLMDSVCYTHEAPKTIAFLGDLAERSKALESGSSLSGREFESHSRQ